MFQGRAFWYSRKESGCIKVNNVISECCDWTCLCVIMWVVCGGRAGSYGFRPMACGYKLYLSMLDRYLMLLHHLPNLSRQIQLSSLNADGFPDRCLPDSNRVNSPLLG